ncbi:MAG: ORF6N domain-containing protein [Marinirhabdus sp.]
METRILKQAVRRNADRFPEDFMFEFNDEEFKNLTSQNVISNHGGLRYDPFVFTEQGLAMLLSALRSKEAIAINISIMRAFVFMRQYAISHRDLSDKLAKLEAKYNKQFNDVYDVIKYLLKKRRNIAKTDKQRANRL